VPACLACHVDARNPIFPQVLGLSAHYIEQQLRLFRGRQARPGSVKCGA
jgi:cytochrome c553